MTRAAFQQGSREGTEAKEQSELWLRTELLTQPRRGQKWEGQPIYVSFYRSVLGVHFFSDGAKTFSVMVQSLESNSRPTDSTNGRRTDAERDGAQLISIAWGYRPCYGVPIYLINWNEPVELWGVQVWSKTACSNALEWVSRVVEHRQFHTNAETRGFLAVKSGKVFNRWPINPTYARNHKSILISSFWNLREWFIYNFKKYYNRFKNKKICWFHNNFSNISLKKCNFPESQCISLDLGTKCQ